MFGFQEPPFEVIKAVSIRLNDGTAPLERRRPKAARPFLPGGALVPVAGSDYLALEFNPERTVIFKYEGKHADNIDSDWQRLINEPALKLAALACSERIDMDLGYRADGSVVMY